MPTSTNIIELSQPPIFEALIEIRFDPNKDVTLENIEKLWDEIKEDYPVKEKLQTYSNTLKIVEGEQQSDVSVAPAGFRFTNKKKNRTVIADFEKITVSYQAPYQSWPALRQKTEGILEKYLKHVKQNTVVRIGMRYINHLSIDDSVDFNISNYTNTSPFVAVDDELSNSFSVFETFCVKQFDDIDCTSHIRQALLPAQTDKKPNVGQFKFVLDIDLFKEKLSLNVDSPSIWDIIDDMRTKRNLIFFGTLTSKALERYK